MPQIVRVCTNHLTNICIDALCFLCLHLNSTGVAGKTPLEQALVDAIVDTIDDFMSMLPWAEKDHDVKVMCLLN